MNDTAKTQTITSNYLEHHFQLKQHKTTIKTEVIAGFTTFLTMVYIVFVNPGLLSSSGMDAQAVFTTTCLIAAFSSIFMGFLANLPVALAPAMGLNAFFVAIVISSQKSAMPISWQIGMGIVFWGAIGLLLLTLFRVRYWMMANIPSSLRIGIVSGIGLFIGMMGLHNSQIIVADPYTLVKLGDLTSQPVLIGAVGFFIIITLASRNIHAAILISIFVTTLLSLLTGNAHYDGLFALPSDIRSVVGQVDIMGALDIGFIGLIFSFMLVNLFDSSGTLIAVTNKAGLADEKGHFPNMNKAMLVDSASSSVGALLGTSSVTAYIESSSGVSVGGKTGLTAIVTGLLFLVISFLSPLAKMIPDYAVAGALIYVAILMASSLRQINWQDLTEATPAFVTAIMMPFSFSITNGIALGFITYCIIKLGSGRFRELNSCVIVVALLFAIKFIFIN